MTKIERIRELVAERSELENNVEVSIRVMNELLELVEALGEALRDTTTIIEGLSLPCPTQKAQQALAKLGAWNGDKNDR